MAPLRLLADVPPSVAGATISPSLFLLVAGRERGNISASTPTEHAYSEASLDLSNAVALDHAAFESSESDTLPVHS